MNDYQLIVIGAGPGGYAAALRAAGLGVRTAVVENRQAGGTCLNRGCVPTKALLHVAETYNSARHGAEIGVLAENVRLDMEKVFAYKRRISETLSQGVEDSLKRARADFLRGTAQITGPGAVNVAGADGGTAAYTADNIIIATGAAPMRPPIPGLDLTMTSDDLLEGCDRLYRSIVIMGGGVIGVEFAAFYARLGCDVTVVEGLDNLLPLLDRELGQNLAQIFKKQGIKVFTGSFVQSIEPCDGGQKVHFNTKDVPSSVTGEAVLCAIGRAPYFEGLFAEGVEAERSGRALKVDERFQTSIPGVYAIGDVSSKIQLAHAASAQGVACVENICGVNSRTDVHLVPSCVYCQPEIASAGMTEAEAKAAGVPVKVGKCVMGGNARVFIAGAERSFMKVVAHAETGEVVGAQLMCPNATDIISQLSGAIANRMTAEQLLRATRPHPTHEEALSDALLSLCAKLGKQ